MDEKDKNASENAETGIASGVDTPAVADAGGCDPVLPLVAYPYGPAWWAALLGYGADDLPPADGLRPWLAAQIHPDDAPRLRRAYADFVAERVPDYAVAFRVRHHEGPWMAVRGLFRATARDAQGRQPRLIGVLLDVTEQKRIEDGIQAEHEKARLYLDMAGTLFVALDTKGRVTLVNRKSCEVLGREEAAILGKDWFEHFVAADERDAVRQVFNSLVTDATETVEYHENAVLTAKGAARHILWHTTLIKNDDGAVTAVLASGTDITERMEAEAALKESQAKARAIMDIAIDAVITIDTQGVIESVNSAAERIFGYTADEMIGHNVRMLMPSPLRERHDQYIQRYLATGQKKVIGIGRTVVARRKDGSTFPIDLALIEVRLGDRSIFTSFIRDISERLRLEREVLHISTEERQRLGRDLHDGLGSMLTGVAMGAQGLAQARKRGQPVDPEDLERLAQMAEEGAEQARALAHGLNPVKLDREGLHAALQELVATTRTLSRIACSFEADDPLPDLNGLVVTQLYWIAQEALNNAVKHAGARHITVRLVVEEGDLVLSVRDDGAGLAGRAKSRRGTGIHIMQYRANLLGAAFSISEAEGRGTHVSCRLPLDKAAPSPSTQAFRIR